MGSRPPPRRRRLSRARAVAALALLLTALTLQPARVDETGRATERTRRALDTVLLPLLVDTVAVPRELAVKAGSGGAITVVGDTIVIVDLKGGFFALDVGSGIARALALPGLPNHADDYDRFGPKPQQRGDFTVNFGFVVHGLQSRKELGGIRLYVSYERFLTERKTTALAVSSILVDGTNFSAIGPWEDVFQSQPLVAEWYSGIAGGGRMVVKGDDLYLTVGDYNQDQVFMSSRPEAQIPDSDFGKIFRIDLRTNRKHLLTLGHRNPQGLTITPGGTMYSTEHGPRGGDELNRIIPGKNYGWPVVSLGTHYNSYDWPRHESEDDPASFEKPVYAWVPSIGVSNLIEVANFDPIWNGDLLVASLKEKTLFRLRRDGESRILYSEPIPLGQRLRDIAALSDGTLVIWTDDAQLMVLSVDRAKLATNRRPIPW